ncbi:MAG TPA: zinc ribbon domain-containing protein [Pyrinomonadaceae bacterium]|nr:zinc ribbon domain-containing protein [Pyrinomonadaceae bacterium]
MFCQFCGTPRAQGLSYCNRCGADLRERKESSHTPAITAMLISITLVGLIGLGIMLGGAVTLRKEANLSQELIGVFMLFAFLVISVTEFMLVRNLSKLVSSATDNKTHLLSAPMQQDLRLPAAGSMGEPVPSVVENTTRTLDYVRRER